MPKTWIRRNRRKRGREEFQLLRNFLPEKYRIYPEKILQRMWYIYPSNFCAAQSMEICSVSFIFLAKEALEFCGSLLYNILVAISVEIRLLSENSGVPTLLFKILALHNFMEKYTYINCLEVWTWWFSIFQCHLKHKNIYNKSSLDESSLEIYTNFPFLSKNLQLYIWPCQNNGRKWTEWGL